MDLSKYTNLPAGVDKIEDRDHIYYHKYEYRAVVTLPGIRRTYFCKTQQEFDDKLDDMMQLNTIGWYNDHAYIKRLRAEVANYDKPKLYNWIDWKVQADKKVMIRSEGDNAAVFSSDLNFLHTLDQIVTGCVVYTQARTGTRMAGIKYFSRQPKYQYRVYMKAREFKPEMKKDMRDFLSFYIPKGKKKNSKSAIVPSGSLETCLMTDKSTYWYGNWLQSHHYIDYDDESMLTLMILRFGDLLGKQYKLEKRILPAE